MQNYKVIIVGAGPAGMMAGIRAAEFSCGVCLLERNNIPGRKLLISGKGRCNLTNAASPDEFLRAFGKNGDFLRDAFKAFSNQHLISFFARAGLRLKTERGGRVFPIDDKSASVLRVLKTALHNARVETVYNSKVKTIKPGDGFWQVVLEDNRNFTAEKVILAAGGASYRATGSDGSGFILAGDLGHKIIPLRPGLVPLETRENFVKHLAGLSLKNVRVGFTQDKRKWQSEIGEMLFTHSGVSGPLILEASSAIIDWLKDKHPVVLSIDFKPGLGQPQLEERLLRDLRNMGGKIYKNMLKELLPAKLIGVFTKLSGIPQDKKANQISASERETMVRLLKDFRLTITRARPIEEAIVTRGGVSLKEINPRTMESVLHKGLYFCGEIIDVDAKTGGYNMQAAFSTGWLAGENAARN